MTSLPYQQVHQFSRQDPEGFWGAQAERLHWDRRWDRVLDNSDPTHARWFSGAKTNLCFNAVDRHVNGGRGERTALVWASPELGRSTRWTYHRLLAEVSRCAQALRDLGVGRGDRVLIYLPMVPEAAVAMLSTVRLGAIHSVVFAGFSYEALARRIDDCRPSVLLCADGGVRKGKRIPLKSIVDRALETSQHRVAHVVVLDRGLVPWTPIPGRDRLWEDVIQGGGPSIVEAVPVDSGTPSYILYTSGTTGAPKGVVRDTGGYMVALHASMEHVYGCTDRDVFWATSDLGWVVGHSYIVYGPLLYGLTTVLYEGTPDSPHPGIWWELVEEHAVSVLFTAPTAMRMLRTQPEVIDRYTLDSLRHVFVAGEPLDEATYHWMRETLEVPIIDHYWQTESGWPMITNHMGLRPLPVKPGSPGREALGWELDVTDEAGHPLPAGRRGLLVARPPLPPGALQTVWEDPHRYQVSYWRGLVDRGQPLYNTGDYARRDEDGYYWLLGRADEVINVAGHRMGTREVEEVIGSHPQVAEASVVGVEDSLKGQALAVTVVLIDQSRAGDSLRDELIALVRERIGPIATPRSVRFVHRLPKTRSGKIMRRVLRALNEGQALGDLSTLEDGATVEEIRRAIEEMGVAQPPS